MRIPVCSLYDLDEGKPLAVEVGDAPVVLVREGETVYALRDECSHAAVALSEGDVGRKGIECFLHGSCFDLVTGAPSSLPATEPVDVYRTSVVDGQVYVALPGG